MAQNGGRGLDEIQQPLLQRTPTDGMLAVPGNALFLELIDWASIDRRELDVVAPDEKENWAYNRDFQTRHQKQYAASLQPNQNAESEHWQEAKNSESDIVAQLVNHLSAHITSLTEAEQQSFHSINQNDSLTVDHIKLLRPLYVPTDENNDNKKPKKTIEEKEKRAIKIQLAKICTATEINSQIRAEAFLLLADICFAAAKKSLSPKARKRKLVSALIYAMEAWQLNPDLDLNQTENPIIKVIVFGGVNDNNLMSQLKGGNLKNIDALCEFLGEDIIINYGRNTDAGIAAITHQPLTAMDKIHDSLRSVKQAVDIDEHKEVTQNINTDNNKKLVYILNEIIESELKFRQSLFDKLQELVGKDSQNPDKNKILMALAPHIELFKRIICYNPFDGINPLDPNDGQPVINDHLKQIMLALTSERNLIDLADFLSVAVLQNTLLLESDKLDAQVFGALNSLAILPVQRAPRYELFFKEVLKTIDGQHPWYTKLSDLSENFKKFNGFINQQLSFSKLIDILEENHVKREVVQRLKTKYAKQVHSKDKERLISDANIKALETRSKNAAGIARKDIAGETWVNDQWLDEINAISNDIQKIQRDEQDKKDWRWIAGGFLLAAVMIGLFFVPPIGAAVVAGVSVADALLGAGLLLTAWAAIKSAVKVISKCCRRDDADQDPFGAGPASGSRSSNSSNDSNYRHSTSRTTVSLNGSPSQAAAALAQRTSSAASSTNSISSAPAGTSVQTANAEIGQEADPSSSLRIVLSGRKI